MGLIASFFTFISFFLMFSPQWRRERCCLSISPKPKYILCKFNHSRSSETLGHYTTSSSDPSTLGSLPQTQAPLVFPPRIYSIFKSACLCTYMYIHTHLFSPYLITNSNSFHLFFLDLPRKLKIPPICFLNGFCVVKYTSNIILTFHMCI